jgi:hypothetical protein
MRFSKKFDTKSNFLFFRTKKLEKFLGGGHFPPAPDTGGGMISKPNVAKCSSDFRLRQPRMTAERLRSQDLVVSRQ